MKKGHVDLVVLWKQRLERALITLAAVVAGIVHARDVRAQTQADPPPALAPAGAAARLDEVEQTARIAARRIQILEEQLANKAKESPGLSVDDKGFALKVPDNAYQLRVRGLMQADARFFLNDEGLQANDTFLIRKLRPSLEGTLFSLVDFRLLPELAGTPQVLDAYADIHPWDWLHVRMGKFKGPIGLERLQSDADLTFLERSLDQNLSSQREVGIQIWGDVAGGLFQYIVAIFNGAVDGAGADVDTSHAKDLAGRLFVQPLRNHKEAGSLGIGLAASIGNRKGRLPNNTQLPTFRSAGQNQFFGYYAPATDTTGAMTTFPFETQSHLNPQFCYYYDAFGVLAEYVRTDVGLQRGGATIDVTHQAAHATLSYVFNGRVGYDGVTPTAPFDRKTWSGGAFELGLRGAWLEVDPLTYGDPRVPSSQYANPATNVHSAISWAAGVNWVPRRSFHASVNYERTRFDAGAGTAVAPIDRATEQVMIARTQVNF